MAYRLQRVCVTLAVMILAGCGRSDLQLEDIRGNATFDGKPIVYGQLELIPDSSKQHSAPAGEAEIVDGKFDTSLGGKGIVPGAYKVLVTAYESRPVASNDETVASKNTPPIFQGFSIDMTLNAAEVNIAVPAEAKGFSVYSASEAPRGNAP